MKFLAAIIVFLLICGILGWGILLAVHGSFWLLAVSALAYFIAFARIGCMPAVKDHH
ncbi:MAG TPA: hypothetical protein GYA07_13100 [Verrucomicrobia bacterium]|nr:hypothetical protein [Verrucomicrobiota bacterium]HOB33854.1 hypothetical protein [Verrucomicrobiota bacterium]